MTLEDERMASRVFNMGGGLAYTIKEFADIVREEVEKIKRLEIKKMRGGGCQRPWCLGFIGLGIRGTHVRISRR